MFVVVPLSSDRTIYGLPWVTVSVMGLCVLVHLAAVAGLFDPVEAWGYRPSEGLGLPLLLNMFVHAGWLHLIGNLIFLWCMGINVESRWGPGAFGAVYLLGGIVATLAHAFTHSGSSVPLVGASGAISAAMGAFLIALHRTQIRLGYVVWVLVRVLHGTFRVPAYVVIPIWFAGDLLGAWGEVSVGGDGVAYTAHVAGFLMGVIAAIGLRATGAEARLIERYGGDIGDDPQHWAQLPTPLPATAPALPPLRCSGCALVNMPEATDCRRCGAPLR